MNNLDYILQECLVRRRLDPAKTPAQIVAAVMAEVTDYRAELSKRLEFSPAGAVVNADTRAAQALEAVEP